MLNNSETRCNSCAQTFLKSQRLQNSQDASPVALTWPCTGTIGIYLHLLLFPTAFRFLWKILLSFWNNAQFNQQCIPTVLSRGFGGWGGVGWGGVGWKWRMAFPRDGILISRISSRELIFLCAWIRRRLYVDSLEVYLCLTGQLPFQALSLDTTDLEFGSVQTGMTHVLLAWDGLMILPSIRFCPILSFSTSSFIFKAICR